MNLNILIQIANADVFYSETYSNACRAPEASNAVTSSHPRHP